MMYIPTKLLHHILDILKWPGLCNVSMRQTSDSLEVAVVYGGSVFRFVHPLVGTCVHYNGSGGGDDDDNKEAAWSHFTKLDFSRRLQLVLRSASAGTIKIAADDQNLFMDDVVFPRTKTIRQPPPPNIPNECIKTYQIDGDWLKFTTKYVGDNECDIKLTKNMISVRSDDFYIVSHTAILTNVGCGMTHEKRGVNMKLFSDLAFTDDGRGHVMLNLYTRQAISLTRALDCGCLFTFVQNQ